MVVSSEEENYLEKGREVARVAFKVARVAKVQSRDILRLGTKDYPGIVARAACRTRTV